MRGHSQAGEGLVMGLRDQALQMERGALEQVFCEDIVSQIGFPFLIDIKMRSRSHPTPSLPSCEYSISDSEVFM
jgi:hypothetical protein